MFILLIMHILIFSGFLVVGLMKKKNNLELFCQGVIVLFIPLFGYFLILITETVGKMVENRDSPFYIFADMEKKEFPINKKNEQEVQLLPINDALFLDDKKLKREIMRDIIIKTPSEKVKFLLQALNSEDAEIAHYAASAVMGFKKKLEQAISDIEEKLSHNPNKEYLKKYIELLENYLDSGLLTKIEILRTKEVYAQALEKLTLNEIIDQEIYCKIIDVQLDIENFTEAERLCHDFLEVFPNEDSPYLKLVKLYYRTKNYYMLKETLRTLKSSEIPFSNTTLQIVRFWDERKNMYEN